MVSRNNIPWYTLYWHDAVKVWTFPATDGLGMSWGTQNRPGPFRSNQIEKLTHWAMRNTRILTAYNINPL